MQTALEAPQGPSKRIPSEIREYCAYCYVAHVPRNK